MLRNVVPYNFVCFKDEVNFKFKENGVYFFMGGNSTGKSSVFEAIRNCLKTTDLKQASSRCNPKLDAFAVCYFRKGIYKIASIYLDDVKEEKIRKISMMTDERNRTVQVYGASRKRPIHNDCKMFRIELDGKLNDDLNRIKEEIKTFFLSLETGSKVDVIGLFELIFPELKKHKTEEPLFDKFIAEYISIKMTLPHRGINPAQSTYADANQFQASSNSADVLRLYLEEGDVGDREEILNVFDKLSNGDAYAPEKRDNGEIEVEISVTEKTVPLLRLPEAVLEGHLASVLLCGATNSTLCLEEPSRDMDGQATKLLCNILKQIDCQNKLVIIATHDPYFTRPWNLSKSYTFSGKGDECKVFNGNDLLNMRSGEITEKVKRFITSYPISLIWFSKRVFLVEGVSDLIFVEAIRDVIVGGSDNIGDGLLQWAGLTKDPFLRQLREFLSSLTIISLGGEGDKKKAEIVCDFLEMNGNRGQPVSRYYLLDRDTYIGINKSLNLNLKNDNPLFTELAEKGVFIWSDDLEIEVALFCQLENLKDLLTENYVPVTNDEQFQIKRRKKKGKQTGKLFLESPHITEVNIHRIVTGILSALHLDRRQRREHKEGGTVPTFLKFIIIAMLESNGQGDRLKWDGEDFRVSIKSVKPTTQIHKSAKCVNKKEKKRH